MCDRYIHSVMKAAARGGATVAGGAGGGAGAGAGVGSSAQLSMASSKYALRGASVCCDAIMYPGAMYSHPCCGFFRKRRNQKRRHKHSMEAAASAKADLVASMLAIFERSILTTHRSKYTQFLIFFMCQYVFSLPACPTLARTTAAWSTQTVVISHCCRNPLFFVLLLSVVGLLPCRRQDGTLPDALVGRLIDTMRSASCARVLRQSCAAYLGSFLARAKRVEDTTL